MKSFETMTIAYVWLLLVTRLLIPFEQSKQLNVGTPSKQKY